MLIKVLCAVTCFVVLNVLERLLYADEYLLDTPNDIGQGDPGEDRPSNPAPSAAAGA